MYSVIAPVFSKRVEMPSASNKRPSVPPLVTVCFVGKDRIGSLMSLASRVRSETTPTISKGAAGEKLTDSQRPTAEAVYPYEKF